MNEKVACSPASKWLFRWRFPAKNLTAPFSCLSYTIGACSPHLFLKGKWHRVSRFYFRLEWKMDRSEIWIPLFHFKSGLFKWAQFSSLVFQAHGEGMPGHLFDVLEVPQYFLSVCCTCSRRVIKNKSIRPTMSHRKTKSVGASSLRLCRELFRVTCRQRRLHTCAGVICSSSIQYTKIICDYFIALQLIRPILFSRCFKNEQNK